MKSPMLPADHHDAVQRALELGRSGKPDALDELVALLARPSNEVQRLAASAIGKLAPFGADPARAVAALAPLARAARHPQTQQYAIRALRAYGAAAAEQVRDLRDVARNPGVRDYVREAAASAADAIEQAAGRCRGLRPASLPALQRRALARRARARAGRFPARLLRPLLRRGLPRPAALRGAGRVGQDRRSPRRYARAVRGRAPHRRLAGGAPHRLPLRRQVPHPR